MTKLVKIKNVLTEHKKELKETFKVKTLGIFGSFVKGKHKKQNDLDILVEFNEPVSLLWLAKVKNHISDFMKMKIDLVPKEDIRKELKSSILKEVAYL